MTAEPSTSLRKKNWTGEQNQERQLDYIHGDRGKLDERRLCPLTVNEETFDPTTGSEGTIKPYNNLTRANWAYNWLRRLS